jgi:hypothetical protein
MRYVSQGAVRRKGSMCRGATTVVFPRWQEQGLLLDSQAAPRVVACDALTATTVVKYYGTAHCVQDGFFTQGRHFESSGCNPDLSNSRPSARTRASCECNNCEDLSSLARMCARLFFSRSRVLLSFLFIPLLVLLTCNLTGTVPIVYRNKSHI